MRYVVVANPRAGKGKGAGALFDALEGDVEVVPTAAAGHGTEIAASAQADVVVAAGGDGTIHEVVNGLMARPLDGRPALGVVPLGSGCDYARTFEIPSDPATAIAHLSTASLRPVDVGEITYLQDGSHVTRYFANIAEVGIGGSTVARASTLPRALGPAMYGIAFLMTLPVFKRHTATISLDDTSYEGPLTDLVVAIGKVFGGGMRVAPEADPSDGVFDVQIHAGTKVDYVRGLPKVYKGTHLPHPRIEEARATTVRVDCDRPARIEADGEMLGSTPATFSIHPGALRLKA